MTRSLLLLALLACSLHAELFDDLVEGPAFALGGGAAMMQGEPLIHGRRRELSFVPTSLGIFAGRGMRDPRAILGVNLQSSLFLFESYTVPVPLYYPYGSYITARSSNRPKFAVLSRLEPTAILMSDDDAHVYLRLGAGGAMQNAPPPAVSPSFGYSARVGLGMVPLRYLGLEFGFESAASIGQKHPEFQYYDLYAQLNLWLL